MTNKRLKQAFSFPPVEQADENGLLAYGGDLRPERLITAYESGVFPWYEEDQPILWWSPAQRMIMEPSGFKVSKSLRNRLNQKKFEVTIDTAFEDVIQRCSNVPRKGQDGTWVTPDMISAYSKLHELGFAHSFESRIDGELVGGLYGVSLGGVFFGESMFSEASDASKVAFHSLSQFALKHGFGFIDCQLHTPHLASLGAFEIERSTYMLKLNTCLDQSDLVGKWTDL